MAKITTSITKLPRTFPAFVLRQFSTIEDSFKALKSLINTISGFRKKVLGVVNNNSQELTNLASVVNSNDDELIALTSVVNSNLAKHDNFGYFYDITNQTFTGTEATLELTTEGAASNTSLSSGEVTLTYSGFWLVMFSTTAVTDNSELYLNVQQHNGSSWSDMPGMYGTQWTADYDNSGINIIGILDATADDWKVRVRGVRSEGSALAQTVGYRTRLTVIRLANT